ncbi:mitotic checkpoint regulator [Microdochium nivale]|nr:mitotic checkpoint regulator [Microdochium nivale]
MGLVEYSDSESDSESTQQPPRKPTPVAAASAPSSSTTKKPFQRIVDRSKPGKIVVSLPGAVSAGQIDTKHDEPPAKRARTGGGGGGGAFSGFNALLPPPKNASKPAVSSSSGKTAPRPGINLKTGATPGFSRNTDLDGGVDGFTDDNDGRAIAEPSIPAGQKPAAEVKLVGKPMMFKPLSVSRKPTKTKAAMASKSTVAAKATTSTTTPTETAKQTPAHESSVEQTTEEPPKKQKKQKMSLFSISQEDNNDTGATSNGSGVYEPIFADDTGISAQEAFAQYDAQYANPASSSNAQADYNSSHQHHDQQPSTQTGHSLDSIASDLNLSAAARRELFGRTGAPDPTQSASRVINFNTDREYAANEELRASGEAQPAHNPVRAIAPGKHSLRQLVNQVQNQRDALEESFAKGHRNRTEASAKYGWR